MTSRLFAPIGLYSAPLGSLNHIGFKAFAPHPYLLTWVQCYWSVQTELPGIGVSENLYPDGGTTLIIDFKPDDLAHIRLNATQSVSKMHLNGNLDRLGIRFQPGGISQLLDIDAASVIGGDFDSDSLELAAIHELQHRISSITSMTHRLLALEDWLLHQASRRGAQRGLIQHLMPRLQFSNESIDQLSQQIALSRRQFERKFREEVGLSPLQVKQFHRIRRARQIIMLRPETPLVNVAYDVGFYDQAHFNRHFQKITGQTPGQYRNKKMSQKYNPR